MVKSVPHHCADMEDVNACPHCGETKMVTLFEWGDDDYYANGDFIVPLEPKSFVWVPVYNDRFHGEMKVDVYDVSRIRPNQWRDRRVNIEQ